MIPVVTAVILAMLMNPVEKMGVGRVWAVLLSDFIVVLFIAFMIFLLAAQANQVAEKWSQIEKNVKPKIEKVQNFYDENLKGWVEQFQQKDDSQTSNQQESSSTNSTSQQQEQPQGKNQSENGQPQNEEKISNRAFRLPV